MCSGCRCALDFKTSGRRNHIKLAVQVAFITAGCTHATYVKALQHVLGIRPVSAPTFMRTIETLHPIVKQMVDEMCEREKQRMRRMDPSTLGSWKKAVTCADGTWMTRGFHSKNATFSIRNYNTGALLYYKHICQRGRDTLGALQRHLQICRKILCQGTTSDCKAGGTEHSHPLARCRLFLE